MLGGDAYICDTCAKQHVDQANLCRWKPFGQYPGLQKYCAGAIIKWVAWDETWNRGDTREKTDSGAVNYGGATDTHNQKYDGSQWNARDETWNIGDTRAKQERGAADTGVHNQKYSGWSWLVWDPAWEDRSTRMHLDDANLPVDRQRYQRYSSASNRWTVNYGVSIKMRRLWWLAESEDAIAECLARTSPSYVSSRILRWCNLQFLELLFQKRDNLEGKLHMSWRTAV